MTTQHEDNPQDLERGRFWTKLAVAVAWMAANTVAANVIADSQTEFWARATAAAVVLISLIVWLGLWFRQVKQSDEFNRAIVLSELNAGAAWTLMFGSLFMAFVAIQAALLPAHTDVLRTGFTLLVIQPPAALLFGTSMAQIQRWSFSRKGEM